MTKTGLRKHFLHLRSVLPLKESHQAAEAASSLFIKHISLRPTDIISLYMPFRDEMDIVPLRVALTKTGHRLCLPVAKAKDSPLIFRKWDHKTILQAHPIYGMEEPTDDSATLTPNVLLVPILACDHSGHRLGYGGGFYDRTLAALRSKNPSLVAIGYGFECQVTATLPALPTDQRLNYLVTQKQVMRF